MTSRVSPRFSANTMAKYLTASASQRRSLIRAQKAPKTFIVARYTPATSAIANYIGDAMGSESIIQDAIDALESLPASSSWRQQRQKACIKALKSVQCSKPGLALEKLEATAVPLTAQKYLRVGDVDISIRPENLIRGVQRGTQVCGVVKQYYSDGHPLTPKEAAYLGTLLYRYVEEELADVGKPSSRLCYVYDVFAGKVWQAPGAMAQRLVDVEAACQEIARAWNDPDI